VANSANSASRSWSLRALPVAASVSTRLFSCSVATSDILTGDMRRRTVSLIRSPAQTYAFSIPVALWRDLAIKTKPKSLVKCAPTVRRRSSTPECHTRMPGCLAFRTGLGGELFQRLVSLKTPRQWRQLRSPCGAKQEEIRRGEREPWMDGPRRRSGVAG
jgi:hypothetical protein